MNNEPKVQSEILDKLNIKELNPMQLEMNEAFSDHQNLVLLSPTGTGKTVAFLLPIIDSLNPEIKDIQAVIIVPARELAIQIEQVIRTMGTGFKANAVYGGQAFSTDLLNLNHPPAILVGTPGRIADHLRRETFETSQIKTLVLDEFDKSLEIGFESEMKEILKALPQLQKKILTSATKGVEVPEFVKLSFPKTINYLSEQEQLLEVKTVLSPDKDKLDTLARLLRQLDKQSGIIFCNFKDTIEWVSDFLEEKKIQHGVFYGGMEQRDRERALIKFRNGTHQFIIATDLAARGIDVPELQFIIHFQLPLRAEEFTHRNGRTARMHSEGTAYVLQYEKEGLPDFIEATKPQIHEIKSAYPKEKSTAINWTTLFVSGGRKDKISKGDIAGLFFKQGGLNHNEVGTIELKQDCAFVAVDASKVRELLSKVNNTRLKKKKVRITEI